MKLPRRFFQPLATGAPAPFRELPVKLERMIHFVPPHNEKVRARVPELAATVDVVLGLESGADDYVVKPYSVVELMARLRTQLRRTRPATMGERLAFEDIILDAGEHRVFRDGRALHLGPTEFRLLSTLMERPGRVWTREQLLDRVWGRDIYVDTRTIDVHVGRLRKALNGPRQVDPIRTVRGAGYAFNDQFTAA